MPSSWSAPFSVDLRGHAALVTGAGADVGRAAALALAQSGAAVVINDINPDRPDELVALITEQGGRALAWQADVANRFQCASMIEAARDAFGRVDILVNAAGVQRIGPMDKVDEWDWRRALDVNLTGAFFCTQLLGRVMAEEGGGVIVNIASTAGDGLTPAEGISYTASKAGLIGLTRQSARELAAYGITVNAVCPGNVAGEFDSEQTPANAQSRLAPPEEIADVVLFLCSNAARFITGQSLRVDGGEAMG
ncbi:MAG TPA: SDR family oxidoreductase [Candidatus Limnocylindrales bacterium]|nr:SDR family oxidoreductase [Candidatus Limnocylindrales bacterium]